ncbi:MAG TPA: hypothetical protein VHZ33_00610 [Trebonia sp.]|jgi:hypothetical protein|nr:hypothetical protein [Trebonia sp.]
MFIEQSLASERHTERLRQAHDERTASQVAELQRMERRRVRAERELIHAWQAVDQLRSAIQAVR